MARNNLAADEFRVTGPRATVSGADDSLQSINTFELPDGALGLVQENGGSVFLLDKNLDPTTVVGVYQPAAAGGGTWIQQFGFLGEQFSVSAMLSTSPLDIVVAANTWTRPAGGVFAQDSPDSGLFTLDTATGRLTYNGRANRIFRISLLCSIGNTAAAAGIRIAAAVSVSGDVTGTDDFAFQQETTTNATQDVPSFICATRDVALPLVATIDPVFKNITDGTDLRLERMALVVTPSP